nr:MAG: capsid protein [Picornaviridae sp.]
MYTKVDIDDSYRIDAKPYIERPFYAGSLTFSTADKRWEFLNTPLQYLPGDVIRSNPSLLNAMKIGSLYRADLVLNISMAGTITHAGKILVAALPPLPKYPFAGPTLAGAEDVWVNTLLSGPHAYLHANEATSVMLTIPWYCNSDMATLDMDLTSANTLDITSSNGNYATLVFMVMNPLAPSAGSSTSLTIVIEACFKHLDILIPTPRYVSWVPQSGIRSTLVGLKETIKKGVRAVSGDFIDGAIDWLASWTGLHNPNDPTIKERNIIASRNFPNVVDAPQFFEKLDPNTAFNRIVKGPIFGSDVDEMSISHITSKKQLLGQITVKTSDPIGTLYWARPISPFQGGYQNSQEEIICANNIELMHSLHRAWRGGLIITIESVMNNKQQTKLRLLKLYNPTLDILTSTPAYATIANAPSALMEFTQGGQEHEISLPYLCRNDLTPCSENLSFEALFHGMYYIYLAQPLANSEGSPTSVEFNIYMHGDKDLAFYGYVSKELEDAFFPLYYTNTTTVESTTHVPLVKFRPQSGRGDSIRVMNEPQKQTNDIAEDHKASCVSHFDRLIPNLDIRPLIRRMYPRRKTNSRYLNEKEIATEIIPLADIIGESIYQEKTEDYSTPMTIISKMYYGKTAGFKFQLRLADTSYNLTPIPSVSPRDFSFVNVFIMYVPPNFTFDSITATVRGAPVNPLAIEANNLPTHRTPFPFQDIPVVFNAITSVYEFTIPDVTLYKFMGSPNKFFAALEDAILPEPLSTQDFGSIYIRYENTSRIEKVYFKTDLYVGLTDESRFGHHTIATPFRINKKNSPYYDTPGLVPTGIGLKSIYYGSPI